MVSMPASPASAAAARINATAAPLPRAGSPARSVRTPDEDGYALPVHRPVIAGLRSLLVPTVQRNRETKPPPRRSRSLAVGERKESRVGCPLTATSVRAAPPVVGDQERDAMAVARLEQEALVGNPVRSSLVRVFRSMRCRIAQVEVASECLSFASTTMNGAA